MGFSISQSKLEIQEIDGNAMSDTRGPSYGNNGTPAFQNTWKQPIMREHHPKQKMK